MSLISPNFAVKSIIYPNFGQGPFPRIAGKSPDMVAVPLTDLCHTDDETVRDKQRHNYKSKNTFIEKQKTLYFELSEMFVKGCGPDLQPAIVLKELTYDVESCLDWLQSLKQFFFNVSYHILVAKSYSDGSVLKQSHQNKTGYKYLMKNCFRETDLYKSFDFFLNPIMIVL